MLILSFSQNVIKGVSLLPRKALVSTFLALTMVFGHLPVSAWQLDSTNLKSGVSSYASLFWVDGVGPVSKEKFFAGNFKEGAYWASFTVSCTKKKLAVTISVNQVGSGHQGMNFDDPGFIGFSINNALPKNFKTAPAENISSVVIQSDAPKLIKSLNGKQYVGLTLREAFTTKVLKPKFKLESLTPARARFKSAGCSI